MNKTTLTEIAYLNIKEKIMKLEILPGSLIVESKLAKELGMSRTPIRAAIQILKQENLIETIKGKGTRVTMLSMEKLLEVFEIRIVMEELSIKLACKNRTQKELEELKENIKLQILASNNNENIEFLDTDRQFHLIISKMSKNKLLINELKSLNEMFKRYLYFTDYDHRLENVLNEHITMLKCIEIRDYKNAQKVMTKHIEDVRMSIILALKGM